MDVPVPLCPGSILAPFGLDVPPYGETPFEELVSRYREALASLPPGPVLLRDASAMAEMRAFALATQEAGRPFSVALTCDEEGVSPAEVDALAALIVLEGMGVSAFGLCCNGEIAQEQLSRLVPYASMELFWLEGETVHPFPYQLIPHDPDVIPCSGDKHARFITPDVDVGEAIECSPDLLEDILRAEDAPVGALKIVILEPDDLDIFAEQQYAVQDALCLWSDVPELLEGALRLYQGRAFYDGTGELEPEFLASMSQKYGLVVL